MKGTVLLVDDNRKVLDALEKIVRQGFDTVLTHANPNRIIETLGRKDVDIVMIDMNFRSGVHNGNEGLFWMNEIFKYDKNISGCKGYKGRSG
jgi:two-component system response regulator HydG